MDISRVKMVIVRVKMAMFSFRITISLYSGTAQVCGASHILFFVKQFTGGGGGRVLSGTFGRTEPMNLKFCYI